jgi:endoglucanase
LKKHKKGETMKKIVSIITCMALVVVIGLSVCACSKSASDSGKKSTENPQSASKEDSKQKIEKQIQEDEEKLVDIQNELKDKGGIMKLRVEGNHLVDASGKVIQLRGVSTHGLSWYPQYVNEEAFKTLRDDWGANVVRLAMYTAEYNGYCSGGNQEELKNVIRNGVKYATDLGMYVIIDWHILSDSSPMQNKEAAKAFFKEMSLEFRDDPNVIYEICNEPQNSPWSSVIKPYAEEIIPIIRENAPDALILCGTNTWSQDVHEVVNDRLSDKNTMYVMHFYAGTHKDDLRNRLKSALDNNLPVFISECSITDASGNGAIDYDSAEKWMSLINQYNVSFLAWSLSNKDESSALLKPSTQSLSGWSDDELSDTGKWFKGKIKR